MDWLLLQVDLVPGNHPPGTVEVVVACHGFDTLTPDLLLPVPCNEYRAVIQAQGNEENDRDCTEEQCQKYYWQPYTYKICIYCNRDII
jgi:hypothetical protein